MGKFRCQIGVRLMKTGSSLVLKIWLVIKFHYQIVTQRLTINACLVNCRIVVLTFNLLLVNGTMLFRWQKIGS